MKSHAVIVIHTSCKTWRRFPLFCVFICLRPYRCWYPLYCVIIYLRPYRCRHILCLRNIPPPTNICGIFAAKAWTYAKELCTSAKEPCISVEKPCMSAIEPCMSAEMQRWHACIYTEKCSADTHIYTQRQTGAPVNIPAAATGAEPSTAANNEAAHLIQDATAHAARVVADMAARAAADANTQAQRTQRVLAEALQERESARLERVQAVQERGRALADAWCVQSCFS